MKLIQFDLFEPIPDEVELVKQELKSVRESCDKVRKGMFARHNQLAKMYVDLHQRFDVIESHLCKMK